MAVAAWMLSLMASLEKAGIWSPWTGFLYSSVPVLRWVGLLQIIGSALAIVGMLMFLGHKKR